MHFQEYLIKSQLHEQLRGGSTDLAQMQLIQTFAEPPQTPFLIAFVLESLS